MKRPGLTYANVMSTLAMFLALTAGGYAAVKLPKNSVGSKQIRKNANAVTSTKIRSNSIYSSMVKNGSLTGSDINLSTLGMVPSAATTDDSVLRVVRYSASTGSGVDYTTARAAATPVLLVRYSHVSIYGKCSYDTTGDRVYAAVHADSDADGGFFASDWDTSLLLGPDGKGLKASDMVVARNGSSQVANGMPDEKSCLFSTKAQKVSR
jgi:hypothetical protein